MFTTILFRKILSKTLADIDQVKIVYFLSLVVGLLSALAAAFLKNTIHFTHMFLTEGIASESARYLIWLFLWQECCLHCCLSDMW